MSGADLRAGLVARAGLLSEAQFAAAEELLRVVDSHGLETVRLSFADQHGILRGKTLTASALASAFRSGMAMTSTLLLKDTSHRTVFPVWAEGTGLGEGRLDGAGDVLIVPDPGTFRILPHSPHSGWMLCDLRYKDGAEMPFCPRSILKRAVARLADAGTDMLCGLEVEFHIHRVTQPRMAHAEGGMPATPPETEALNHGYQYLTEGRYAEIEEIMDRIRRAAQTLDLPVRSMEVEFGPSQVEMTFDPADPLRQADAMVLFRTTVKELCRREGLHATFMCRPRTPNAIPSGWHLHQSLLDRETGRNLFRSPDGSLTPAASGWIAGLLAHAAESCLLSTPTVNGYKRYQPFQLAPDRIQWGRDNKGAMLRSLIGADDPASRIENRVAEPAANPYLFIASQIHAGLDGIARGLAAPEPVERPYESDAAALPRTLGEAVERFAESAFWQREWGDDTVRWLSHIKRSEWQRYLADLSEWEEREYYALF